MKFECIDISTVDLDLISTQANACEKFKTGKCAESCPYYREWCVGGMLPSSIAVIQRYANAISRLKGEPCEEKVDLDNTVNRWLSTTWYMTKPIEEISEMAKTCVKYNANHSCSNDCPHKGETWCIGLSVASDPIAIFARYATEIEKIMKEKKP